MYSIRVKNVTKKYDLYEKPIDRLKEAMSITKKCYHKDFYALKNIDFEVKKGETVGIIGTNGSGKSTILKIITGVLSPTDGEVQIDGRISALLELGAGFNMEYTGIENIYMNGIMMGYTREEMTEKLPAILEFADIGDFVNHPVKSYSSGMFVRLAFSVAINIEPEILIVDEALSVGDVFFQAKCYHKFEEFKKMGKTILFVTHDMGAINKYCERAILLNRGDKVFEGSPKEAIDIYKKLLANPDEDVTNSPSKVMKANSIDALSGGDLGDNTDIAKQLNTTYVDSSQKELWKDKLQVNPDLIQYGNGMVDIFDFVVYDRSGQITTVLDVGDEYTIGMKVRFIQTVKDPIFAMTLKDIKGTEITGTNTMHEGIETGLVKAGEMRQIMFTQKMNLQRGAYLISLGCTGFKDGDFVVYERLYDVCSISVLSSKNIVGYYDLDSKVEVL